LQKPSRSVPNGALRNPASVDGHSKNCSNAIITSISRPVRRGLLEVVIDENYVEFKLGTAEKSGSNASELKRKAISTPHNSELHIMPVMLSST